MPKIMKIADEWHARLAEIARIENKTLVAALEDAIRLKMAEHDLPLDLPGVTVEKRPDGVVSINVPDTGFSGEVSTGETITLIRVLELLSKHPDPDLETRQRFAELVGKLSGIKVERMARGVRIVSPLTGKSHPMVFSIAGDLAELLQDQITDAAEDEVAREGGEIVRSENGNVIGVRSAGA